MLSTFGAEITSPFAIPQLKAIFSFLFSSIASVDRAIIMSG